jgi:hypothetical protein
LNNGDKLLVRGYNSGYANYMDPYQYNCFVSTGDFDVQGNIMSLIAGNDFENVVSLQDQYAFASLFANCTHLIHAHNLILPATDFASGDYREMFSGCTSLVSGPTLPALKPFIASYDSMFYGCSSLTSITCLATDISEYGCVDDWMYGVAANGTFTKNPAMSSWETGDSGIPTGWTVQDAS